MKIKTIDEEASDKRLSLYPFGYFIFNAINITIKSILPISDSLWKLLSILTGVALISLLAIGMRDVRRRIPVIIFKYYMFFILLYGFSVFKPP